MPILACQSPTCSPRVPQMSFLKFVSLIFSVVVGFAYVTLNVWLALWLIRRAPLARVWKWLSHWRPVVAARLGHWVKERVQVLSVRRMEVLGRWRERPAPTR